MDIPFLIDQSDKATDFLMIALAIGWTVYGLILMFFGYRLYKLWATLSGLGVGGMVAIGLSIRYLPDHSLLHYFLGLIGAAIGGGVFFYLSIFLFGAFIGVGVAHLIGWSWLVSQGFDAESGALHGMVVSYVIAGLTAGSLALLFKRPFLIILTSLGGAAFAILGASLAAGGLSVVRDFNVFEKVLAALTFVILSVVGIIVQLKVTTVVDEGENGGDETPARKKARKSKSRRKK